MTIVRKRIPVRQASKVYPEDKSDGNITAETQQEFHGYLFNDGDVLDSNEMNDLQEKIGRSVRHVHNEMKMHEDYADPESAYHDSKPSVFATGLTTLAGDYTDDPEIWKIKKDPNSFRHRGRVIEIEADDTYGGDVALIDGMESTDFDKDDGFGIPINFATAEQAIANLATNHPHHEDHIATPENSSIFHTEVTITSNFSASTLFFLKTDGERTSHPDFGISGGNMYSMEFQGDDVTDLLTNMRILAANPSVFRDGVDITSDVGITSTTINIFSFDGNDYDSIDITFMGDIEIGDVFSFDGSVSYKTLLEMRRNFDKLHSHEGQVAAPSHKHSDDKIFFPDTGGLFPFYQEIRLTSIPVGTSPAVIITKNGQEQLLYPSNPNPDLYSFADGSGPDSQVQLENVDVAVLRNHEIFDPAGFAFSVSTFISGGETYDIVHVNGSDFQIDDVIIIIGNFRFFNIQQMRKNIGALRNNSYFDIDIEHEHNDEQIFATTPNSYNFYVDVNVTTVFGETVMHIAQNAIEGAAHGGTNMLNMGLDPNRLLGGSEQLLVLPVVYAHLIDGVNLRYLKLNDHPDYTVELNTTNGIIVVKITKSPNTFDFNTLRVTGTSIKRDLLSSFRKNIKAFSQERNLDIISLTNITEDERDYKPTLNDYPNTSGEIPGTNTISQWGDGTVTIRNRFKITSIASIIETVTIGSSVPTLDELNDLTLISESNKTPDLFGFGVTEISCYVRTGASFGSRTITIANGENVIETLNFTTGALNPIESKGVSLGRVGFGTIDFTLTDFQTDDEIYINIDTIVNFI